METLIQVAGVRMIGTAGNYLILGPHDNLIACAATYAAGCDIVSRVAASHIRHTRTARYYDIRMRNWERRHSAGIAARRARPYV